MKTKEEWNHTKEFIDLQREHNPNWTCRCSACRHVEAIQLDAIVSVTIKPSVPDLETDIDAATGGAQQTELNL
jgi:hypothetical protein